MSHERPSLETIKRAYMQAAHIVAIHGDQYLPLFERIENEYKSYSRQNELLTKAISAFKSNSIN